MTDEKNLTTSKSTAPVAISAESLIAQAIQNNIPVETMERLLAMRKDIKAEHAKEEYDRAMAAFQSECPVIKKTKNVKTNSGAKAYSYAPIEVIVTQVKDILKKHGFSYSTNMDIIENGQTKIKATVKVVHEAGHSEETSMIVPLGTKTGVMSDTQVFAAAQTFAKRYAFCNAFGILTGDEDIDGAINKKTTDEDAELDEKIISQIQSAKTVEALTKMCSGFKKVVKPKQQKALLDHYYEKKKELEGGE